MKNPIRRPYASEVNNRSGGSHQVVGIENQNVTRKLCDAKMLAIDIWRNPDNINRELTIDLEKDTVYLFMHRSAIDTLLQIQGNAVENMKVLKRRLTFVNRDL